MARRLALAVLLGVPVGVAQASGSCPGTVIRSTVTPLGQCKSFMHSGQKIYSLASCNGQWATVQYFGGLSGGCRGSAFPQHFPVNKCSPAGVDGTVYRPGMAAAFYNNVSCSKDSFTVTEYAVWTQKPTHVTCSSHDDEADSLYVTAQVDAQLIDEVTFEVSKPGGKTFAGYLAQPDEEGHVRAVIPGLAPGTRYEVRARAHTRGEAEGNPSKWSSPSEESATCSTSQGTPTPREVENNLGRRWIEVYRSSNPPADFLDQHNVADINAAFGVLPSTGFQKKATMTRYCVEVLDAEIPGVVTADTSGLPQTSQFADYLTCNRGRCLCMNQVDRSVARLPAAHILALCSGGYSDAGQLDACKCSPESTRQSNRFMGRAGIPLPYQIEMSMLTAPVMIPPGYPAPYKPSPMGYFYSLPVGGMCPHGARPGEGGCTWQRSPLYHQVHAADLDELGLNHSRTREYNPITKQLVRESVNYETSLHNIALGKKAFEDLKMPPCGSVATEVDEDRRLARAARAAAAPGVFV